jgi:chromosome segregation ATPase
LTEAAQTEGLLTSEVSALKKEVASAQYSEMQLKGHLASANDEISELTSRAETLAVEKRSIEHSLASVKASLTSQIEEKDGELRSARQQLETMAREKADVTSNFEAQIRGLQASLQSTVNSQDGLHQEATKTKEALLTANSQAETLRSANRSLEERLEASSTEIATLKKQLADYKASAEQLRGDLAASSVTVVSGGDVDHYKKQIQQLKDQLSSEQKSLFESKQAKEELSARVASQQAQVTQLNAQLAEVTEALRVEKITKHEAAVAAEKEAFKEINAKLSKTAAEKAEAEKQLKDAHTEKAEIDKQLKEASQTIKDQAALIKEQKDTITRLEAPPPAPFLSQTLKNNLSGSGRAPTVKRGEGTLESEILGIKDTLQKIDTSALSKKKDSSNDNILSSLLMSGLEKRYKASRPDEDVEDLASEDLYIPNESEEEWR